MLRKELVWIVAICCASFCSAALAAETELNFELATGDIPRDNRPVRIAVQVPSALFKGCVAIVEIDGVKLPGQITRPRLLSDVEPPSGGKTLSAELYFVPPKLAAGTTVRGKAVITEGANHSGPVFQWRDTAGKHLDLVLGERPVLRYMYEPLDTSSNERRFDTMKVYHHVFDPTGKYLLTKGTGGKFPHHRGIYFGFNRISYGDKLTADTWHCNKGEYQSHEKIVSSDVGPVLGRHVVEIAWHGKTGDVFARELRELTAYATLTGTLVEFASVLRSEVGPVKLDGDPQHAGFQFRASQEVADKTSKETYYLRPDGKAKPGEFRNWTSGTPQHANLPWNAMSFVVSDTRYTCCYLDRPENPKESRFSERDYGRFGSYFEYELDANKPLRLNYRVWLQPGELDVATVQAWDDDFTKPAVANVK